MQTFPPKGLKPLSTAAQIGLRIGFNAEPFIRLNELLMTNYKIAVLRRIITTLKQTDVDQQRFVDLIKQLECLT